MNEPERYAFRDPWKDPERLFPSFMAEMKGRFPEYSLVWDRRREQWLCYHRQGEHQVMAVAYVEYGDGGAADPAIPFLDLLAETDIIRRFGTKRDYADWLEKQQEETDDRELAELRSDIHEYALKPILDYIERGAPETFVLRPFEPEHRRQVDRDLALSLNCAELPRPELQETAA